jgi:hypothetical protein
MSVSGHTSIGAGVRILKFKKGGVSTSRLNVSEKKMNTSDSGLAMSCSCSSRYVGDEKYGTEHPHSDLSVMHGLNVNKLF